MGGESMREQLASAVRSIQWSYAIFWSPSSSEPGALEWGEGYYNGDIKTRKTILAMEMSNNDQLSYCQRSDQLRELYVSLLSGAGDANPPQARRPSAALSPEDLTNAEWYYLVCMSFFFRMDQGLPGRCMANGRPIWLSNAHCTDTKIFCRSLLAKSAGIKTVVCFPFLNGVIELGATDLVEEDSALIQHVKATFLEISSYPNTLAERHGYSFDDFRTELFHGDFAHLIQDDDQDMGLISPTTSSKGFLAKCLNNDEVASQAQSWQLIDDELSNCVHTSMTSSDCISQTFANPEKNPSSSPTIALEDQELHQDPLLEDLPYRSILSSLFKKPHQMVLAGVSFHHNLDKGTSFAPWENGGYRSNFELKTGISSTSQKMLKAILVEVPRSHELKEDGVHNKKVESNKQPEGNEASSNHVLAERRRREKVNERFSLLKSLIPAASKADKVSILDDTIAYLKELERRVIELETNQEPDEPNRSKSKRKPQDVEERTSDNYGNDTNVGPQNKRRARGNEEECNQASNDNSISVSVIEKDVLIEIRCPWKDSLFLDIIDTLSDLHLDSHSVQSSTLDGILSLSVKSKVRGSNTLSVGVITQALQRVLTHD